MTTNVQDLFQKIPPSSIEAEQGVLGGILLDNNALNVAIEMLEATDFYNKGNRFIYGAMLDLFESDKPIDLVTLTDELKRTDKLEKAGGITYVSSLTELVPTAGHINAYAKIVAEKAILRRIIATAQQIAALAYEDAGDIDEFTDSAQSAMFDACSRDTKSEVSSMKEVVKESFHIIEKTAVGEIRGIETGFTRYDELTGGLHKGELIIIAARPGDGKTTLATNIVTNIAMNLNEPSLFFSLEMDKASLGIRALCAASSQSSLDIKPNGLSKDAFSKYLKAANLLQNLPIFIDDSAAQTVLKIKATLRKYKAQHNISLAVIDYLQLMKGGRNKDNSREQQVAEISRSLKIMAKELKIPIVALCQMNREIVKASRRPRLSDLRESGAIEQDADVVLFLHRPRTDDDEDNGPMEAILAKQRNGPTGIFRLAFLEEFNRFENYTDLTEWSNM